MQSGRHLTGWTLEAAGMHAGMMKVGHAQRLLQAHTRFSLWLSVGVGRKHTQEVEDDDDEMLEEWLTARKPSKQGRGGGQKGRRQN
jgi:hypothetical protein